MMNNILFCSKLIINIYLWYATVTYGLAGNCIGKKDSLRQTAIERGALQRL